MTLSEVVTAENLHGNNSGVRPPETVIAGRFAYYPILILTHFTEIQKPSITLRKRALSSKDQETKFPNRKQVSKSPRDFLLAGKTEDPFEIKRLGFVVQAFSKRDNILIP